MKALATGLRERLETGDTAARKKRLAAIVVQIVVTKDTIWVIGRHDNSDNALKNKGNGQPPVRNPVQEWCRK